MSFLSPLFLFGLAALLIPIVVHLLNLRKTSPMTFPTLRFFTELIDKTVKRIKIKEYILLALRLLAVLFMSLALARPLWISENVNALAESERFVLILDNSPSMEQIDGEGPYFDQAKSTLRNIVNAASDQGQFLVLPTDGRGQNTSVSNKVSTLRKLASTEISFSGFNRDFLEAQISEILTEEDNYTFLLVTDGQVFLADEMKDIIEHEKRKTVTLNVIQVGERWENNASITDVRVENTIIAAGKALRVATEVTNFSENKLTNSFLSIKQGDQVVGQYSVSLDPWQSKEFLFETSSKPGTESVLLSVELEGDRWLFDNTRWLAIDMSKNRKIMRILQENRARSSQETSYFETALQVMSKSDVGMDIQTVPLNELSTGLIAEAQVIILDGLTNFSALPANALSEFMQKGGGLIFIPSQYSTLADANRFLRDLSLGEFTSQRGDFASFESLVTMDVINDAHPIFSSVFENKKADPIAIKWPSLFAYWMYSPASKVAQPIFSSSDRTPIFIQEKVGEGSIIVSGIGTEPGWSTFPANALYPAFWVRAIEMLSGNQSRPLSIQTGESMMVQVNAEESNFEVLSDGKMIRPTTKRSLNGQQVYFSSVDVKPGIVKLKSDQSIRHIAIQPNTKESDFRRYTSETLPTDDKTLFWTTGSKVSENKISAMYASGVTQSEIWQLFLLISLLLLATEIIFARFYSAENIK